MLELFKKPIERQHVNPRIRAYGKARIDIASRANSRADWERLWKRSTFPFPFTWGESWKQCIEYKVDDFAAEVGFYIDILGLPVNAFDPDYAMFTSPNGEFYFSVVPALEGEASTPPEAIRIQFMVAEILEVAAELERRGIFFEGRPQPCVEGSSLFIGYFRTPHGIPIDLWGLVGDDFSVEEALRSVGEDEAEAPSKKYNSSAETRDPDGELAETESGLRDRDERVYSEGMEDSEDEPEEKQMEMDYEYVDEEDIGRLTR